MSLLLLFCYSEYMRLNKFIAHASGVSRREADSLIDAGSVLVNGKKAQLGCDIDPIDDIVFMNGKRLTMPKTSTTIMLNKPVGYVCSRNAQAKDVKTVYALLPDTLKSLKTVGRLDKDSSGLILLTDDGDLAHRLTHPRFAKNKEYVVKLDHALAPLHQQMISDFGIGLDDGPSKLLLERLDDNRLEFRVTMHEGRNRQIRRTFAALGYQVVSLHRTCFGPYQLGNLGLGKWIKIE